MSSFTPYYRPMRAPKETSLMLMDVVEVEETMLIGSNSTRKNIGWVLEFPDSRIRNYTGDASEIRIMVTEGPDSELPITYALNSRFPVRLDRFARMIARVPKEGTLLSGMTDVKITRISRGTVAK